MPRHMRGYRFAAGAFVVLALGATGMPTATYAGTDNLVVTTVSPIVPSVNVSTPTSVGYTALIENRGNSTASNVRFVAQLPSGATNVLTEPANPMDGVLDCSSTAKVLECRIGQLRSGESYKPFRIFFQVPAQPGTVTFVGTVRYSEGQGPSPTLPNASQGWAANPQVVVGAVDDDSASALVPPTQTAANVVLETLREDVFSTQVDVPAVEGAYAPASIKERTSDPANFPSEANCNSFTTCFVSKLDIKRTDGSLFEPHMTVFIRMQAANALPGTQPQGVVVLYSADDSDVYVPVDVCPQQGVAYDDKPCIDDAYQEKSRSNVKGPLVWKILTKSNGSYRLP